MERAIINLLWFKSNHAGNVIAQIESLLPEISQMHYKSVLIFPEEAKERAWCQKLINDGIKVLFVPMVENRKTRIARIYNILRKENASLMHLHFGEVTNEVIAATRKAKIPLIIHERSDIEWAENWKRYLKQKIKYCFYYNKITQVVLNQSSYNNVVRYGKRNRDVYLLPNGIDFARFCCNYDREEIRKKYVINNKRKIVLMMGYNIQVKGVDTAVEAVMNLKEKYPEILLCVVASSNYEKNKNTVYNLPYKDLKDYVVFLPANEHIGEYYAMADLFLSASRTEGFSNSLVESIYMRKPAVISNIDGTKWAKDYPTVREYQVGNVNDLAQCLEKTILENYSDEILLSASAEVEEKYSCSRWSKKIIDIYKKMLNEE